MTWTKEQYDLMQEHAHTLGYHLITPYRKGLKNIKVGVIKEAPDSDKSGVTSGEPPTLRKLAPVSPNTNIEEQVNILNILMYLRTGKTDIETAAKSIEALLSAVKISELEKLLHPNLWPPEGSRAKWAIEERIKELEKQ